MNEMITNKDKIQKYYLDIITKIHSRLFPEMSLKKILWNETMFCQSQNNIFKIIVKTFFCKSVKIETNINQNKLLCLYTKNYRNDHDAYWQKIKEDCGEHDDITLLSEKKYLDLNSFFKKIYWYIVAYIELRKITNNRHRKYLALQMVNRKWTLDKIDKMNLNPKVVMCFFDSSPDENVLMQYFKNNGAITVTNQHGQSVFQSFDYDRVNQSQILNFKCDYYLAKGEMQISQFLHAGFSREHFINIGIVGGNEFKVCHHNTNCFGVFLDCPNLPFAEEINYKILKITKKIAEKAGLKYIIKIHPSDNPNKFESCIDKNCIGILDKKYSLSEVMDKIDFGIIHATSTYVDIYAYGLRCFKLDSRVNFDIAFYDDVFVTEDELYTKLIQWKNKSENEKDSYILKVRKLYDSGWKKGLISNAISMMVNKI